MSLQNENMPVRFSMMTVYFIDFCKIVTVTVNTIVTYFLTLFIFITVSLNEKMGMDLL